ncbi:MAG: hypothetical protein IJ797_05115 [Selenomonadaceae bacterium]|nr:hypothetical protein [Selenomonadaceae bacterium]
MKNTVKDEDIINTANKIKSDVESLPKKIQDEMRMERIKDTIRDLSNEKLSLNTFLDIANII